MSNTTSGGSSRTSSKNPPNNTLQPSTDVPTYLFRLHAPRTVGTTTTTVVASPASDIGGNATRSLFELPPKRAADSLNAHLWWDKDHEKRCNLMSWSSSLLFLLQYGLYRRRTDFDKPSLSNIYILVLDTSDFPCGTFIKDLDAIDAFVGYADGLDKIRDWRLSDMYFGEYFSQGSLNVKGRCHQASMQQFLNLGLFTLCPPLKDRDQWDAWVRPVMVIRGDFRVTDSPTDTEKGVIRTAITMAEACFGGPWTLPMAAMLLSLQPRRHDDEAILNAFRSMFTDDEISSVDIQGMKFDRESWRLPELKLYKDMLTAICQERQPAAAAVAAAAATDELLSEFENLSLRPQNLSAGLEAYLTLGQTAAVERRPYY